MGLINIGPEAWAEVQEEVQKLLSQKGLNNYTACSVLLSLSARILADMKADQTLRNEIVRSFLKSMGYTP